MYWTGSRSPQPRRDTYTSSEAGRIGFDFSRLHYNKRSHWIERYPYNELKTLPILDEPIEDIRLAAIFQPEHAGLRAALSTTARLGGDKVQTLTAAIAADGKLTLTAGDAPSSDGQGGSAPPQILASRQLEPIQPGENREVELWYVDQEASVWVDGERMLRVPFDLPLQELLDREPAPLLPQVGIEVSGSPVTLHRVQLDRDLYYSIYSGKLRAGR